MPMFGVRVRDFQEQIAKLVEADEAAAAASERRSQALAEFVNWAITTKGRVIGSYMDDLLCEFYA